MLPCCHNRQLRCGGDRNLSDLLGRHATNLAVTDGRGRRQMTTTTENRTESTSNTVSEVDVSRQVKAVASAKSDSPPFSAIAHILAGCKNRRPNRIERLKRA
jgi:hypothetical protein